MLRTTHFKAQHYSTLFNPQTGFFARLEDQGFPEPSWAETGPELLDISLTNWCDRGCEICYGSSSTRGRHMPVAAYRNILRQAARIGVLQVALGGGNPNQHPSFVDLLQMTREEFGIVPSYTSNGRGLTAEITLASRRFCGAVAVTAHEPYIEFAAGVRTLLDSGVKTNAHFVLDSSSVDTAIKWLTIPPPFLDGLNALVFLSYKPVGRQTSQRTPLSDSPRAAKFFDVACARPHRFRVGFDSCLVSGLAGFSDVNPVWFDACEATRFSMFISEDCVAFPCSFMTADFEGIPVGEANLQQIWQRSPLFNRIRQTLLDQSCAGCSLSEVCMGGCPVFEGIDLCKSKILARAGSSTEVEPALEIRHQSQGSIRR
jgi:radical SAM protein with 4Fe4S-binding SPASM domain